VFCFQTGETAFRVGVSADYVCVVASEDQARHEGIDEAVLTRAQEIHREGGSAQRL
jgi:hypothetical protein